MLLILAAVAQQVTFDFYSSVYSDSVYHSLFHDKLESGLDE
jgi:hypothetical protein